MKLFTRILPVLFPVLLFGGDYGAAFLNIGVGARALALGGAFSALVDDGTAFYWNPAGLAYVTRPQVNFMYGPQFGSIREPLGHYHYLGFTAPLRRRAVVSLNWIRLSVDDIPVFSELRGDSYWDRFHDPSLRPTGTPEGYITDAEDALFFSFGINNPLVADLGWSMHKVRIDIPVGVTLKWFRQILGEAEATGLGIDIGAMCRIHMNDFLGNEHFGILSTSLHIKDMAGSSLSWNTMHNDEIPAGVVWGLSYSQPLEALHGRVNVAWDNESRWGNRHRFGLEYQGFGRLALRAGLNDGDFSCGAGVMFWKMRVDYAFLSHELDNLHRISCAVNF